MDVRGLEASRVVIADARVMMQNQVVEVSILLDGQERARSLRAVSAAFLPRVLGRRGG